MNFMIETNSSCNPPDPKVACLPLSFRHGIHVPYAIGMLAKAFPCCNLNSTQFFPLSPRPHISSPLLQRANFFFFKQTIFLVGKDKDDKVTVNFDKLV